MENNTTPKRKITIIIEDDGKIINESITVDGFTPPEAIGHIELVKQEYINGIQKQQRKNKVK